MTFNKYQNQKKNYVFSIALTTMFLLTGCQNSPLWQKTVNFTSNLFSSKATIMKKQATWATTEARKQTIETMILDVLKNDNLRLQQMFQESKEIVVNNIEKESCLKGLEQTFKKDVCLKIYKFANFKTPKINPYSFDVVYQSQGFDNITVHHDLVANQDDEWVMIY
jgi:hypothetical protein